MRVAELDDGDIESYMEVFRRVFGVDGQDALIQSVQLYEQMDEQFDPNDLLAPAIIEVIVIFYALFLANGVMVNVDVVVQQVVSAFSSFDWGAMVSRVHAEYNQTIATSRAFIKYTLQNHSLIHGMIPPEFSFGTYADMLEEKDVGSFCLAQDIEAKVLTNVDVIPKLLSYKLISWLFGQLPISLQTDAVIPIIRELAPN